MRKLSGIVIWSFFTLTCSVFSADNRISYTALSDAAKKDGSLVRYLNAPTVKKRVMLGGHRLELEVPEDVRAYDVVPIRYKFQQGQGSDVAIEATAFEDSAKAKGRAMYDLAIPGDMKVKIEYLGSIGADYLDDEYILMTADPETPISPFPPFKRGEFVKSSAICQSNLVWFKFKITNTGDTILDPEGFAGCFAEPFIYKIGDDGKRLQGWQGKPLNMFTRHLEYVYPDESYEQWVNFNCPALGRNKLGLTEGKYEIAYRMLCRFYDEYDWMVNIWSGTEFARLEVPITVTNGPAPVTPIKSKLTIQDTTGRMPGYFSSFEEFMTSFKIYPACQQTSSNEGTIYLQVAPWTENIVVKLITKEPKEIAVVRVPVKVDTSPLDIKYNPDNTMVVSKDGRQEPAFVAQIMPAMRLSMNTPFHEKYLHETLKEAKDLGVNVVANTAGDWWIHEFTGRKGVNMSSAVYKYFYDVLIRELDMKVMGWSVYPPSASHWFTNAEVLLNKKIDFAAAEGGYKVNANATAVDMGDPAVPEVIAAWVIYQYKRWGDTWYKTRDGRVPIDIEDTWGWLRDDINIRYGVGQLLAKRFPGWVKDKYQTIENVNKTWDSNYSTFNEIDPQAGNERYGAYLYDNKEHVFHDFSAAMEDWDIFRTQMRIEIMRKTNELIRKEIPKAELAPRTEGGLLIVKGDAKSSNTHLRHLYYNQRRNALIFDVVKDTDEIHFFSDYTTVPYTLQEWRDAMAEMVSNGVIPILLPQFDHMRDIILNPHYGLDYEMHYGLDKPSKGVMIHCLTAAYPWWKATYQAGGAPGILWSDYLCDGFATETQKRELKILTEHFNSMKRE